jgi:hypothetical protein
MMKKILFLVMFAAFAFSGFTQNDSEPIQGKWSYSVDAGGTILTGVFHFFEKEGQLTGEILSDDGYTIPFSKLEQKEPNKYYMEAKTDTDLIQITLNFNNDKYSGMASSYQGEAPISGERKE